MLDPILIPAWVDGTLTPVEKLEAHQRGLRHLAISVFIMDGERTLLQQRALGKYHTPGLWTNAVCTHPHWGETVEDAAPRRVAEELGIPGLTLHKRAEVEYRADVGNGLIEHEVVSIFVADVDEAALRPRPNPDEVAATRWITLTDLRADVAARPAAYTPWLAIYLAEHAEKIFAEGLV